MMQYIFYAPNIHSGGGKVLLKSLLDVSGDKVPFIYILDERVKGELDNALQGASVYWVRHSVLGRIRAEIFLRQTCEKNKVLIFCFHGLPPLFYSHYRNIVVFLQNRLHFGPVRYSDYALRTAIRLFMERILFSLLKKRGVAFVVQTHTMARVVKKSLGPDFHHRIRILPFVEPLIFDLHSESEEKIWDFVYTADGVGHKNHKRLVQAWIYLAKRNVYPSLALTLGGRDSALLAEIEQQVTNNHLKITNLGELTHAEVIKVYRKSSALIFPSHTESFGLPLIEAQQIGLPILAAELDYVRDVCTPVQTFDPYSVISIARAIERFFHVDSQSLRLLSPDEFLQQLILLSNQE